ncbi:lysine transporter LysE [Tamilnaduibacter salinus]|uniref:Lysine transporter LysE n=1 Tax=Tamilnaduibacter salinus TaxID=1484056 RepID=A0A2A2I5Q5_9GAMM|nr:LysE/ArgO family amino acid transporter [Tamilnaduibacter salinus]PAV26614.1 lysine transporter LysE [Tamilnaduibacter salinus]
MVASYLTGLVVCIGIIVAIGAQNAYLLGQSVRRQHHWPSAALCISSDVVLFSAGMLGVSAALVAMPTALEVLRWVGVVFLGWLAAQSFWRAAKGRAGLEEDGAAGQGLKRVLLTTLAVTVLNPQVYLDTLLLIPAIGIQQSYPLLFLVGAISASILWFSLLAWGGSRLAPWLAKPAAWRIIDGGIGLTMLVIAVGLAQGPVAPAA